VHSAGILSARYCVPALGHWGVLAYNAPVPLTVFRRYIVLRCGDTVEIHKFSTVPDGTLRRYSRVRVERTVPHLNGSTTCRRCGAPKRGGTARIHLYNAMR